MRAPVQLLVPGSINAASGNPDLFPVRLQGPGGAHPSAAVPIPRTLIHPGLFCLRAQLVMSCIVAAVKQHGDLMRMAIASPGNDFRLGAMEAPPAVMSTYLGDAAPRTRHPRSVPALVHAPSPPPLSILRMDPNNPSKNPHLPRPNNQTSADSETVVHRGTLAERAGAVVVGRRGHDRVPGGLHGRSDRRRGASQLQSPWRVPTAAVS